MHLSISLRRELYVLMIDSFHLHAEKVPQMKGTAGPSVVSDLLENCYTQAEYDVIKRVAATSYTGKYLSAFQKFCLLYRYPLAGIEPVCYLVFNRPLRLIRLLDRFFNHDIFPLNGHVSRCPKKSSR